MTETAAVLQLVILRDGLLVGTEVFVPGKYTVGSARTAELRLEDAKVEPQHAVLYFHNARAAIQDAQSRGGVFVNGHRIRACEIRAQDEVQVGPFLLKIRILTKQPAAQPSGPPPEVAALLGATSPGGSPLQLGPSARPAAAPHPGASAAIASTVPAQAPVTTAPAVMPQGRPRATSHALADTAPEKAPSPPVRLVPPPSVTPAGTVPSARRMAQQVAPQVTTAAAAKLSYPGIDLPTDSFTLPSELEIEEETAVTAQTRVPGQVETKPGTHEAPAPRARSSAHARPPTDARGPARLNVELWWGADRQLARSFGALPDKATVRGAHADDAAIPLWGFTLPANAQGFELLQRHGDAWRLFVPPEAAVEVRRPGTEDFLPLSPGHIREEGGRRYVELAHGTAARLSEGEMSLVAFGAPAPERMRGNPLAGMPWLVIALFVLLGGGFTTLVVLAPDTHEVPDFVPKHLPPVAVKLIAPEPKKKEEAAKKLAELKEKAPAKKEAPATKETNVAKRQEKRTTSPAAQENKALKALSKLTAAGPATTDVLAAVDKMGSGPGSKKNSFKLSDMVGKDPIANAGLGTVGLGGGGRGGAGTRGLEVLQGKGGGGIGALGSKGFGSGGKVGGTVTRASARQVAAQGSIDRDGVAKVINANLQEVRACYERALLKEPGLAGKAVLEWSINTQGGVTTAKTKSSTLRNAEVEACILRSIKTWKFPQAKGGQVIVTYPFVFNSVGY